MPCSSSSSASLSVIDSVERLLHLFPSCIADIYRIVARRNQPSVVMTELAALIANCSFIRQTVLLVLQDKTCFLQEKNFPSAPHAPLHCYSHGLLSLSLALSLIPLHSQLQQQKNTCNNNRLMNSSSASRASTPTATLRALVLLHSHQQQNSVTFQVSWKKIELQNTIFLLSCLLLFQSSAPGHCIKC